MTSYHGGKQRICKKIAQKISEYVLDDARFSSIKGYCEPFSGMGGVYRHIPDLLGDITYLAGGTNGSVIVMWEKATAEARKGNTWEPPASVSEEEYNRMKRDPQDTADKGFVGHQFSFGGQYFHGYGPKYGKTVSARDAAAKRANDIANSLIPVKFSKGDYKQYTGLKRYIIYCDPPYVNTECRYGKSSKFDNDEFWDWAREIAKDNIVFVSNYDSPKGTEIVYRSDHHLTGFQSAKTRSRSECLYLVK